MSKQSAKGRTIARSLTKGPFDQKWYDRWKEFASEYDPYDYVDVFNQWRYPSPLGLSPSYPENPFDNKEYEGYLFGSYLYDSSFAGALVETWPATY